MQTDIARNSGYNNNNNTKPNQTKQTSNKLLNLLLHWMAGCLPVRLSNWLVAGPLKYLLLYECIS